MSDNKEDSTDMYAPRAKELCRIQEGGNLVAHYTAACQIWRGTLVSIREILHGTSLFYFSLSLFLSFPLPSARSKQTCKFFGEHARLRRSRKQYVLILSDLFISRITRERRKNGEPYRFVYRANFILINLTVSLASGDSC